MTLTLTDVQKALDFNKVWGRIGGRHAKGWKGHRAWRARHRKHVAQRIEKRLRAAQRRSGR